jgi:hypothetical protein
MLFKTRGDMKVNFYFKIVILVYFKALLSARHIYGFSEQEVAMWF